MSGEESRLESFTSMEHKGVGFLYVLFGSIGVTGNLIVFWIFWRERPLPTPRNVMHINLALGNILSVAPFAFSGSSSFYGKWLYGKTGCTMYGIETFTAGTAAVGFVNILCVQKLMETCCKDFISKVSTGSMYFLATLNWLHSLAWALAPAMGWNSYTVESSGTACGLDWSNRDYSHRSYHVALCAVTGAMVAVSLICLKVAYSNPIEESKDDKEAKDAQDAWFSDRQLFWITTTLLVIMLIGWGPYGYMSFWSVVSDSGVLSNMASVLPPLFAKGGIMFYPIPYLVASQKFRESFRRVIFGVGEKNKSA